MMRKIIIGMYKLFMFALLIIISFSICAFSDDSSAEKEYSCWIGAGIFSGNTTYQIGGSFIDLSQQINANYPFPLSKLQFPLNVSVVTVGNEYLLNKYFEIRGDITRNITGSNGKEQDTDYFYLPGQVIQTYSSSDSNVQTIITDIGVRYWVGQQDTENLRIKYGLGGAMLYEHLEWRLSNLNQFDYYDYNGNQITPVQTTQSGLIGTYETTTNMPYLEIATEIEKSDSFSFLLGLGYSPVARISDEDNHILRQIVSTTALTGSAYKVCLQAKYNLSKSWILTGTWDWISFDLTGTENDLAYDGSGDTWTEGHEISTTQSILSLSLDVKF